MLPIRRSEKLVVQELPGEVLVYDLERHRAHCLNQAAAFIWRSCDGRTSEQQLAEKVAAHLDLPANPEIVTLALDRLKRAHLLEEATVSAEPSLRCSRRDLARRLGMAGGATLLLPMVMSIVAPTAAEAASCVTTSQCKTANVGKPCCSGGTCTCIGRSCGCQSGRPVRNR